MKLKLNALFKSISVKNLELQHYVFQVMGLPLNTKIKECSFNNIIFISLIPQNQNFFYNSSESGHGKNAAIDSFSSGISGQRISGKLF